MKELNTFLLILSHPAWKFCYAHSHCMVPNQGRWWTQKYGPGVKVMDPEIWSVRCGNDQGSESQDKENRKGKKEQLPLHLKLHSRSQNSLPSF